MSTSFINFPKCLLSQMNLNPKFFCIFLSSIFLFTPTTETIHLKIKVLEVSEDLNVQFFVVFSTFRLVEMILFEILTNIRICFVGPTSQTQREGFLSTSLLIPIQFLTRVPIWLVSVNYTEILLSIRIFVSGFVFTHTNTHLTSDS